MLPRRAMSEPDGGRARQPWKTLILACADIDQAGYWSAECWGGATFDSMHPRCSTKTRGSGYGNLRKLLPNTRLQMLLRGLRICWATGTTKTPAIRN